MNTRELPWPVCSVCNRPVESMESYFDREAREVVFVAKCHGDTETTRVSELDLLSTDLRTGLAFTNRRLSHEVPNEWNRLGEGGD